MQQSENRIVVSVPQQRLWLECDGDPVWAAPVSTSKHGLGCEPGSWKTPTGLFRVCEKIGEGAPPRAIFKGRCWTGGIGEIGGAEEDLILSRILWLEGLEPGNANTRERYIYLHGTNAEGEIGTPASIGCVRLRNTEMIDLFDRVGVGTLVEIREE